MVQVERMMTIREAAAFLNVSDQTLRKLSRDGAVPAFKLGGTWRFQRSALSEWMHARREQRRESKSDAPAARRRILVVDDEDHIREIVQRVLKDEGFIVDAAADGVEALRLMNVRASNMVLTDLKMPGMDGPTLIKEIRETWGAVPIAVLTGYPESSAMAEVLKYSPVLLLSKPFRPGQIVEMVKEVLK